MEAASPKYSILYFLSEKGGSQNVWRRSFNGKDAPVQITKHEMHPVRFLSCSSGGDLVYGYDGEIWRLPKGADEPTRVEVKISQGSLLDGPFYASVTSDISELAVSQDGTQLAIVARGEVFVVDPASGKTRRITTTPEHESNVSFNPDGSRLLCISHRDGKWDASHLFPYGQPAGSSAAAVGRDCIDFSPEISSRGEPSKRVQTGKSDRGSQSDLSPAHDIPEAPVRNT